MVLEYTVFCEASLLRYGRVMQILLSKGEMAPDMLITSHVLSLRAPLAERHKRPSCQCSRPCPKLLEGGTGSIFLKDKEHDDILYSCFDILSEALCVRLGYR